jgi:hypothetical protein
MLGYQPIHISSILKMKTEYKWLFKHTSRDMSFAELATAIRDGTYIIISGGSHTNKCGAAAWRLISSTSEMHP